MIKNIWQYQNMLNQRLLRWAGISIVIGFMMRFGGKFWRGVGGQFIAWGAIDAAIALGGRIMARRRIAAMENPGQLAIRQKENRSLGRILWINAALDVLYVIVGKRLSRKDDSAMKGMGWGVIVQGAFLLIFDIFHALNLPEETEE